MIHYINSYKKLHNKEILIERNNLRANKNQKSFSKTILFLLDVEEWKLILCHCFLHEELLQETLFSEANKTIHFLETNDPSFQPFSWPCMKL